MAIALVISVKAVPGANGGATAGVDTTGADLLVMFVGSDSGVAVATPTDSKSNSWSALTEYSATIRGQFFYSIPTSVGAAHTFTYSRVSSFPIIVAMAFSGVKQTSPFDQESGVGGAAGTTRLPGTITPSEDNELIVTGLTSNTVDAGSPFSIDSAFTIAQQNAFGGGNNYAGGAAYLIQTSLGAINPTWSWTTVALGAAAIASFKAASAVSPPDITYVTPKTFVKGLAIPTQSATNVGGASTTWTVDSGALPTGLSLNATTGDITGTPTVVESQTFVIKASNAGGSDTMTMTYNIVIAGSIQAAIPSSSIATDSIPDSAIAQSAFTPEE